MSGKKLVLIILAGLVLIMIVALLSAELAGAPPTVPPDPTPTPRTR